MDAPVFNTDATTDSERTRLRRAATQDFMAPKRPRRAYGDHGQTASSPVVLAVPEAGVAAPLTKAIQAMLNAHTLDWSPTQLDNCRIYLLSATGRFQLWCRESGIERIDQLTTDGVAAFLAAIGNRRHGAGLKASTVNKYRTHLRSLARFQSTTPGYGHGLADIHRSPTPRMPRDHFAPALSRDQERAILDVCTTVRDRLIIELFLASAGCGSARWRDWCSPICN